MEHLSVPCAADCGRSPRGYRARVSALLMLATALSLTACGTGTEDTNWGGAAGSNNFPGGTGTATLAWDTVAAAAGYRVYYGTAPRAYGQGQPATTNSYQVTGLSGQTTYYFAVTAVDSSNSESPYSNEVSKAIP